MGTTAPATARSAPRTGAALSVLGPVEVRLDGVPVDLGTPKQRSLVAALALAQGRPLSVDAIVDLLWGDLAPAGVTGTLQAYVSELRRVLEPGRPRRAPASVLVTTAAGYALRIPPDGSDAARFEAAVAGEHRRLGVPLLGRPTRPAEALAAAEDRLTDALRWWRGRAYDELGDASAAVAARAHLEELRLVALEDRAVTRLALGEHATVAAELEALTTTHPLRERLWALRALSLVRSGRQAEALEVLEEVRRVLADELGLDPGPELRDLQGRVLRQDPALAWHPPPPGTSCEVAATATTPHDVVEPPPRTSCEVAAIPTSSHDVRGSGAGTGGSGEAYDGPGPLVTAGAPWPMLGRDTELRRLETALAAALQGRTTFAVVTGEPGIGKSRLCAELADRASSHGVQVLLGRCSQDDGAPPLWPWATVLERLGSSLPGTTGRGVGMEFAAWESVGRVVRDAAAEQPVLLVLDDLHWADTATLRVLRLLAETSTSDRLLAVATWRDRPRPTGTLADVAETLARRHAVRLELRGLDLPAVARVVDAVTARRPSADQVRTLRERTDGNPFFLVEYARLAGTGEPLSTLLEEEPPTAVQEVVGRRLDRLPEPTLRTLRVAAVVGRAFDVPTVAGALGVAEEDMLDDVDPAVAAGLVREDGVDRFSFSHALVRDTLAATLSPSRRARLHAAVAATVAGAPERETEEARHWLNAGDAHAARAWRAASRAAEVAMHAHAHPEAAELLSAGLKAIGRDPSSTLADRYDLLLQLATAHRWAADWPALTAAVEAAIDVADRMGDPRLAAEAAISTTQGALWQSAPDRELHQGVVSALRRSLEQLPGTDSALRCRVMLSLAHELYYAVPHRERRALVDEALAMAERLAEQAGDRRLLLAACQTAFVTLWVPSTAEERLRYAERALVLARELGDDHAWAGSAVLRTAALGELGRPAEMWPALAEARSECERLHLPYGLLVLDTLAVAWRAMAGDFDECEQLVAAVVTTGRRVSLKHSSDAVASAVTAVARWRGRAGEVVDDLIALEGGPFEISATVMAYLWAAGREDEARAYLRGHPVQVDHNTWFSALAWCHAAEVALHLARPPLGAAVYGKLAPLAGHSGGAGSGGACGPVDAYLALAAASVGDRQLAARHADAALAQCEEWQIPLCAQWLNAQRDRYGF